MEPQDDPKNKILMLSVLCTKCRKLRIGSIDVVSIQMS